MEDQLDVAEKKVSLLFFLHVAVVLSASAALLRPSLAVNPRIFIWALLLRASLSTLDCNLEQRLRLSLVFLGHHNSRYEAQVLAVPYKLLYLRKGVLKLIAWPNSPVRAVSGSVEGVSVRVVWRISSKRMIFGMVNSELPSFLYPGSVKFLVFLLLSGSCWSGETGPETGNERN